MQHARSQKIEIFGRVPTKKNAKRIIRVRGRLIVISSKAWLKFEKQVLEDLGKQKLKSLKSPYSVEYSFYMVGKGATDLDNLVAGINDVLQKCGVVDDDKNILEIHANKVIGEKEYVTNVIVREINP